jgi:hypothetical protein
MELQKIQPLRLYKNAYGDWTAEETYRVDDTRVMRVLTMKRFGGALVTSATVGTIAGSAFMYNPSEDYSERLGDVRMRCTEKVVRTQHMDYAASPDRVRAAIERAVAHYKPYVKQDRPPLEG